MADKGGSVASRLRELQDNYILELPGKFSSIDSKWQQLKSGAVSVDLLRDLHREVHSLAGSGATFGLPQVSQLARSCEILLKARAREEESVTRDFIEQLDQLLTDLGQAARNPGEPEEMALSPAKAEIHEHNNRILIVDRDEEMLQRLADQLRHYGYDVTSVTEAEFDPSLFEARLPGVLIADTDLIDFWGDELAAFAATDAGRECAFIFTSLEADIEARLKAVRAGGCAYFLKPVTFSHLIDRINSLTQKTTPEPYRVLIVDDSASIASFLSTLLESNGMMTQVVTNPLEVLEPLYHFQPDVLLMDIYMPECSGTDLAKVIRQDPKFVSVPIVYLSTEKDVDAQLLALSRGGDDFLTKPVVPEQLINTMNLRCARARMIRDSIVRDSLTGLFNHSYLQDQLERELVLAEREGGLFSFCLLDVDHFKQVNDTYGHQSGDQVLKSLATFLSNRLRRSDVVGRYGGEEFAVILPGCDAQMAKDIMDEVRESFGRVLFQVGGDSYNVSFSAGVSCSAAGRTAVQMVAMADAALYEAKGQGRNRIQLAAD